MFLEATLVFMLRDSFGGYCDNRKAHDSAFADGPTRNPIWRDGGCVPQAPRELAFGADGTDLVLTWLASGDADPGRGLHGAMESRLAGFRRLPAGGSYHLGALTYALGPGSESAGYQVQQCNGAGAVATASEATEARP